MTCSNYYIKYLLQLILKAHIREIDYTLDLRNDSILFFYHLKENRNIYYILCFLV